MAKKKRKPRREPKDKPTYSYLDDEGNILVLRQELSKGTIKAIREEMVSDAANVDDIWRRRTELLFERLAVSWTISGLPLDDQAMLLGRYRMADTEEKKWVRETINRHVEKYLPDLS